MRVLLLDIETAPLTAHVWGLWDQRVGINQIVDSGRTICWAAKWLGDKKVMFDSVLNSEERDMVGRAHELLDAADVVVHFNGNRFDVPTLNKEFLKFGFHPPSPFKQVDLLKVVRKQFKLPSNKLDYVCQFLGLGSKLRHKGHELWVECMEYNEKAWRTMERYNKQDVIILEKLYNRLLPWIPGHPNRGLYDDTENALACPTCGSKDVQRRGLSRSKAYTYQRYQCKECGTWSRERVSLKSGLKPKLTKDS